MRLRRAILVLLGGLLALVGSGGPAAAASVSSNGLRHDTFSSYNRSPFGAAR